MAALPPKSYGSVKKERRSTQTPYNKPKTTEKNKKIYTFFPVKTRRFLHYINSSKNPIRMIFTGKIKPEKRDKSNQYFDKKILKNEQLCNAPDGIYTWIRTQSDDIYATQIESNQEIGTLHHNLIYFAKKRDSSVKNIIVSGEFEITTNKESRNKHISYNFKSGYFFKEILQKLVNKNLTNKQQNQQRDEIQKKLSDDVLQLLQSYCPDCEIEPKLNEDFIEYTKFITNNKVVNFYRNIFNNKIIQENDIGIEKGKTNNQQPINVIYKREINLREKSYPNNIKNELVATQNKSLNGGYYSFYKNKINKTRKNKI